MEIFMLYETITSAWGYANSVYLQASDILYPVLTRDILVLSLLGAFGVWLIMFLFQAFGLYRMAKGQGVRHKWLAFLPFANFILVERLGGRCTIFGQRMRRPGIFALVAQVVTCIVCGLFIAAQIYLYSVEGPPQYVDGQFGSPLQWVELEGLSYYAYVVYTIFWWVVPIIQFVCNVFLFVLFSGLYKRYQPRFAYLFAFLTLLVPIWAGLPVRYIFVFVFRRRPAIDYEDYIRRQREEFIRRQQQQQQEFQRQYGQFNQSYGPYGQGNYGPYGQANNGNTASSPQGNPNPQNPAATTSSAPAPSDEPFAEFSGDSTRSESDDASGQKGEDWFN